MTCLKLLDAQENNAQDRQQMASAQAAKQQKMGETSGVEWWSRDTRR